MTAISKAIARRQEIERRERRERILNAARNVFFKKGYIGASMRDIALKAELSPGLIYHYFKNKDIQEHSIFKGPSPLIKSYKF